ncbi:MAG: NUDIX hydrolase [Pseudomonadota bacterium]
MSQRVLRTGPLLDPAIFATVIGREVDGTPLLTLDEDAAERLSFYATALSAASDTVETQNISATRYAFPIEDTLELARLVAAEVMVLQATHSAEAVKKSLPQIRMRAATRLRAQALPSPGTLHPQMTTPTEVIDTKQPYTDYFAVREDILRFPYFSGSKSSEVKRASFMGGDAVTILPYDPKARSVLLVRQFRHGPLARGDANPWTLEPAAGRIDPGESPEDTARRELQEETGAHVEALHFVARYYPSPGAYSEFLYSFIGIADLSGKDQSVSGLADEAEDIMSHVLSLDDAMRLVETGEVNTGPLILSLQWLAMNAERL